ncbi:hypothetical protein EC957_011235, partial [Mortierella hygrophila]
RIKHRPGVVLDVVLSSTVEFVPVDSPMAISRMASTETPTHGPIDSHRLGAIINELNVSPSPRASSNAEVMQDLVGKRLAPSTHGDDIQHYLVQNVGRLVNDVGELKLQGDVIEKLAHRMIDLQQQALDRLVLIQSKTEAILTQQLELTEYPIPRLFIVLPEEPAKYDPGNWFRTKFRLHFISNAFFKKYGPFLLLMLELIKVGASIAGHVVPILSSLKVVEQSVELITAKIDYSLECIDNQMAKVQASSPGDFIDTEPRAAMTQQDLTNYLRDVEGLEGVELRQLGSFLKTSEEENLLGNLYRMATSDGHVKWVCRDHYRASYQEKYTQKLRDVVKLARGEFDEQLGRVEIVLRSRFAAAEFYKAVSKAKGILELIMDWDWECTRSDLEELEKALKISTVSILRLDLRQFRTGLRSKLFSTSTQYKVLFPITELSNMKTIHIVLPEKFSKLYSLPPKHPSHLHKLSFEMVLGKGTERQCRILAETFKTNSAPTWYFYYNPVGSNGVQALSEALKTNKTLTTLDLAYNSIGPNGAQVLSEALKTNRTLINLDLSSNSIGSDGAKALAEALKTNKTLTTLDLAYNSIGLFGVQVLSEALKTNRTLINLDLSFNPIGYYGDKASFNPIGSDGAKALAEALKTNKTLTTLDLHQNLIGDNGAQALSEALKTNSALTTLNLNHNLIGEDGVKALAEALKTNKTLTTLDLQSNSIGPNGVQALVEALKTNSTLTTLELSFNEIGDNGAQALSEALKTNKTLTTLDLRGNSIGSNGAQALSEALKTNSTLTTLDLYNNSIGDNGAKALAEALKTNKTLTTLELSFNEIGDNGAQALSEALKTNSTLTTLDLQYNSIGDDGAKALAEALKTNKT